MSSWPDTRLRRRETHFAHRKQQEPPPPRTTVSTFRIGPSANPMDCNLPGQRGLLTPADIAGAGRLAGLQALVHVPAAVMIGTALSGERNLISSSPHAMSSGEAAISRGTGPSSTLITRGRSPYGEDPFQCNPEAFQRGAPNAVVTVGGSGQSDWGQSVVETWKSPESA